MKIIPVLAVFFLLPGMLLSAQPARNRLPEKELAFFREKIDSLPVMIARGEARSPEHFCRFPGHRQYYIKDDREGYINTVTEQALHVNGVRKSEYIRMYVLNKLANDFYSNREYDSATRCWQEALAIARAQGFILDELHVLRPSLNNNYFLSGDYTHAMEISSDGLANAEKIGDTNRIAHFTNVIGYIHLRQKNFDAATQYYQRFLLLSERWADTFTVVTAWCNLADLALAKQQYDTAISCLRRAIAAFQSLKDSSYYTPPERRAFFAGKLAEAFQLKGDCRGALRYALEAIAMTGLTNAGFNKYDVAGYYIRAGSIYNCLQLPDSALHFLRSGWQMARQIIHRENLRDASRQLAIAFSQKRIFDSAYAYQAFYTLLKDSLDNESNRQEILQREAQLKIEEGKKLQQAALEKQKRWRNIILGSAVFTFITLGFLYNRRRLRQKNQYQRELNRQQNELFNAIAAAQDQERKRIAEDIHDSLGSILSAAKLKLSALQDEQPGFSGPSQNWKTILELLDEASAELRNISHNIMPATLSKLGLVAALKNLVSQLSSHSGIQFHFTSHEMEKRLDEQTEMSIYRIILELINNSIKHAGATRVTVQLIRHPGYINLSVEDNGQGFNYEKALQAKKGIGLGNIRSRVGYLEGKMDVDSVPGHGTTVIIDIPYPR